MSKEMIKIHECQRVAQDSGFDSMKFMLFANGNVKPCRWIDAYFGFFVIDLEGEDDGFITTNQLEGIAPDAQCLIMGDE